MPPSPLIKLVNAARRAVATFLFASLGLLIGSPVFGIDADAWKLAASAGLGALANLLYRWAEKNQQPPIELEGV